LFSDTSPARYKPVAVNKIISHLLNSITINSIFFPLYKSLRYFAAPQKQTLKKGEWLTDNLS